MKQAVGVLFAIWSIFCMLLFYWIGLLGEGFSYSVNHLVYLKLGVGLWTLHGFWASLSILLPVSWRLTESKFIGPCMILGVLVFDLVLVLGGRPITFVFAMVPIAHGLITLWLYRVHRTAG